MTKHLSQWDPRKVPEGLLILTRIFVAALILPLIVLLFGWIVLGSVPGGTAFLVRLLIGVGPIIITLIAFCLYYGIKGGEASDTDRVVRRLKSDAYRPCRDCQGTGFALR